MLETFLFHLPLVMEEITGSLSFVSKGYLTFSAHLADVSRVLFALRSRMLFRGQSGFSK